MNAASRRMGFVLVSLLLAAGSAVALDVPVSVHEPRGVAREAFPASGGIPFRPGEVKDVAELSMTDAAGKPVPAQFTRLLAWPDGSVQWALCDVLADVPAGGTAQYTIHVGAPPAAPAAPATPLKIDESDGAVAFDTGVVQFVVGKKQFNLFDRVSVGGKPLATGGRVSLTGGRGVWYEQDRQTKQYTIEKTDARRDGRTFQAAAPTRVTWEYRGPLRATLRLDGPYADGGQQWLAYTARITAWAGSGLVRVEFALRNSDPARGDDAFIAGASLGLDLADDFKGQGGGENWAAGGDGQVGLLVQDWHSAGIYRGPGGYHSEARMSSGWLPVWPGLYGQQVAGRQAVVEIVSRGPVLTDPRQRNGALGFTKDGVFALADRAHKESDVWFDFYAGSREPAANEARAAACRSKLTVTAAGGYCGDSGALSTGTFGTLADEIACYRKWGWAGWDDPEKRPRVPAPETADGARRELPASTHIPDAYVAVEPVHEVTEGDALEGYLLMWLRTGMRGYFDWAEAFAGYFRGHAVYRYDWGPQWGNDIGYLATTPFADAAGTEVQPERGKARPPAKGERGTTGVQVGWYAPHCFDWWDSRMHRCHHYASGLLDYYCLTGNTDAKEAAIDLAEEMAHDSGRNYYAPGKEFDVKRNMGRMLITFLTAWRATGEKKWKLLADQLAGYALQAPNWDEQLSYYRMPISPPDFIQSWVKGHLESDRAFGNLRNIPPRLDEYLTKNDIKAVYQKYDLTAHKGSESWQVCSLGQTFETSIVFTALERYARVMDSAPMKKRAVELAAGARKLIWNDRMRHAIYSGCLGWPEKDMVCTAQLWEPDPQKAKISGFATKFLGDIFARAYTFSGDPKFLAWGKEAWDRGSKRGYQATEQSGPDGTVGRMADIWGSHHDDCLECCARLFYEGAHQKGD